MNQARKRTTMQKVLSMILVLVMLLSLMSMSAFNDGNERDRSEQLGTK